MSPSRAHPPIRMLACDLDGTLLPFDGGSGAQRFTAWWERFEVRQRPVLCYNSGRLCPDIRSVVPLAGLPPADFIIGGVGTSLMDRDGRPIARFHDRFAKGWDRSLVQQVMAGIEGVTPQPAHYQSPYKSSWYLLGADQARIAAIREMFLAVEMGVHVVYSSDRDLDVLPAEAGKGQALRWLCDHLGIATDRVVVAGDTENDLEMFRVPGVRGIVVANARPGLYGGLNGKDVYHASTCEADGVIEGLEQYGLHPQPTAARRPSKRGR